MQTYNIVLLGGSNSIIKDGLRSGLEQENIHLTNLALGMTGSLQNLYELKLPHNQEVISKADIIITESFINDLCLCKDGIAGIEIVLRSIHWFYGELAKLDKKVLVLILPFWDGNYSEEIERVYNIHKICVGKYGFNAIDMQKFYQQKGVMNFFMRGDKLHQISPLMRLLGKNIANNLGLFHHHLMATETPKIEFGIISPKEMEVEGGDLESYEIKNSLFCKEVFRLEEGVKLRFQKSYYKAYLVGLHVWNDEKSSNEYYSVASKLCIQTKDICMVKAVSNLRIFQTLTPILIDEKVMIFLAANYKSITHKSEGANKILKEILPYCNLIDFFVVYGEFLEEDLMGQKVEIKNDFNFLIPNVEFYKELIQKYLEGLELVRGKNLEERLGEAVLKVSKRWYKGGYLWLWYKARQIKKKYAKEFNEKE